MLSLSLSFFPFCCECNTSFFSVLKYCVKRAEKVGKEGTTLADTETEGQKRERTKKKGDKGWKRESVENGWR